MKTSNLFSALQVRALVFPALTIMFALSGCSKDDLTAPANLSSNEADKILPVAEITFDHHTVSGTLPDYRVTVDANGSGIFEGRKNVALIGEKAFRISKSDYTYLKNLFYAADFFHASSAYSETKDERPVTLTRTTYSDGNDIRTITDNTKTPQWLVQLRKQVESNLPILDLITGGMRSKPDVRFDIAKTSSQYADKKRAVDLKSDVDRKNNSIVAVDKLANKKDLADVAPANTSKENSNADIAPKHVDRSLAGAKSLKQNIKINYDVAPRSIKSTDVGPARPPKDE